MSGNFAPGDLVVCVDGTRDPKWGYGDEQGPRRGDFYFVRDAELFPGSNIPTIRVHEIWNEAREYNILGVGTVVWEPSFGSRRFRPVDPSRLEIFRKALTGRPLETEDA